MSDSAVDQPWYFCDSLELVILAVGGEANLENLRRHDPPRSSTS